MLDNRTRTHKVQLLLRLGVLRRRSSPCVLCRVQTRGNGAVPSAALGGTECGSESSAAAFLPCSLSSGFGGASVFDVIYETWRR